MLPKLHSSIFRYKRALGYSLVLILLSVLIGGYVQATSHEPPPPPPPDPCLNSPSASVTAPVSATSNNSATFTISSSAGGQAILSCSVSKTINGFGAGSSTSCSGNITFSSGSIDVDDVLGVSLTVTDIANCTASDSATVTVGNTAPTLGSISASPSSTMSYNKSFSIKSSGSDVDNNLRFWGILRNGSNPIDLITGTLPGAGGNFSGSFGSMGSSFIGDTLEFAVVIEDASGARDDGLIDVKIEESSPVIHTSNFNVNIPPGSDVTFGSGPIEFNFSFDAHDSDGDWHSSGIDWVIETRINNNHISSLDETGSFPVTSSTVSGSANVTITDSQIDNPSDQVEFCLKVTDRRNNRDTHCVTYNADCPLRKLDPSSNPIWNQPSSDVEFGSGDGWGSCNQSVGQQYRDVVLRYENCDLSRAGGDPHIPTTVREMRSCQGWPDIEEPILRDSYSDMDAFPIPNSNKGAFGPLKSTVTLRGDQFYPIQSTGNFYRRRTHTEIWAGGVKLAGTDTQSNPDEPYITNPTCGANAQNCTLKTQIKTSVPECTQEIEVKTYVKPFIYERSGGTWDSGESHSTEVHSGARVFVVTPTVNDAGTWRQARFTMTHANLAVDNSINQYLASLPPTGTVQGPTGTPLSLTLESAYFAQSTAGRGCRYGGALCGFGERFIAKFGFFNDPFSGGIGKNAFNRIEKDVDFLEIGKPWDTDRIYPLVPFLEQGIVPAPARVYACGKYAGTRIGFLESDDEFELLTEPFAIHQVLPAWGMEGLTPTVWGYNLDDVFGVPLTGTLGGFPVSIGSEPSGISSQIARALSLPDDTNHPPFEALSPLRLCRNGYCDEMAVNVMKQPFNPGGKRLPEIESVSAMSNWNAAPEKTVEDIPYRSHYCVGEQESLQGGGFGATRGTQVVQLWSDGGWRSVSNYVSWDENEIVFTVPNFSSGLQSVDCPRDQIRANELNGTAGALSDLRLPARVCQAGLTNCQYLNQDTLRTTPPARSRIVSTGIQLGNYCMDDRITITGSSFGDERYGATVKLAGKEVARYLEWSNTKVVVTPPAEYFGARSPECPRSDPNNGLITTASAANINSFVFSCPDIASGGRGCFKLGVDIVSASDQIFTYNTSLATVPNLCNGKTVSFNPGAVGLSIDPAVIGDIEVFSSMSGWEEIRGGAITEWTTTNIEFSTPGKNNGRTSPDCSDGPLSIFTGPFRVCAQGTCKDIARAETSGAGRNQVYRTAPLHKQYWIGPTPTPERVTIRGNFFEDVGNPDAYTRSNGLPNDIRSTAYVEFYSDEFGFLPAYKYFKWTDTEIIAEPPRVSLMGMPHEGVSIAGMPVRVCTREGCVTNLAPTRRLAEEQLYFPEGLTMGPACFPMSLGGERDMLLTVYGKDLHKVNGGSITLDDSTNTFIPLNIYMNVHGVKERWRDKIVFKLPGNIASRVSLPSAAEPQVKVGTVKIKSPFLPFDQELSVQVTFAETCDTANLCNNSVIAPHIDDALPNSSPVEIQGCNFGERGDGSSVVFGDIVVPKEMGENVLWTDDLIRMTAPPESSGGLIAVNAWTGLHGYAAIWEGGPIDTGVLYTITEPGEYSITPSIFETIPRVGVEGQIIDIYGGGFCVKGNCANPIQKVLFGAWQSTTAAEPEIMGARARVFDYNDAMVRVEVPGMPETIETAGDMELRANEIPVSGQVQVWRGDGIGSPLNKTDTFNPFLEAMLNE